METTVTGKSETFNYWHSLRTLKDNPIYRREAGLIGEPNPFYKNLRRYSFFFFMGAMTLGGCGGITNRSLLMNVDPRMAIVWMLICIPGVLISMLTLYGVFMAPAITGPSLGSELDKGSWDIIRLTPQPMGAIVLAKLFGGLARLGIWPWLAALSLIEGAILFIGAFATGGSLFILGLVGALTAVLRPWLEIFFSAFIGMYVSTWIKSAPLVLATSYGCILGFKMMNNVFLWYALFDAFDIREVTAVTLVTISPTIVYLISLPLLVFGIIKRAKNYG